MTEHRYAELHAHSAFSFLDGASQPEDLAHEAARLGLSGLALTDHDGLYGVVRFAQAARDVGLPTIFGAELHLPDPDGVLDPPTGPPDPRATHLLVLARGPDGYRALSTAIAEAHLATGTKGAARYRLDELAAAADGQWLVLTGCRKGAVRHALERQVRRDPAASLDHHTARTELDRLVALFGADNVAVEITDTGDPRDGDRNDALADLAAAAGLPLVATGNVHYARPADADLAAALAAVRARSSLDDIDGWLPGGPGNHLRSAAEMVARHGRHPEAVRTAAALAVECAFDLSLVAPNLPPYPVPPGHDEASWLRELVRRGAAERYGTPDAERVPGAYAQIAHELDVIESLGFPGYFLIVHDLTAFCRENDILCQGRGSAANSAVCYALGVTAVDAVRHGLLFERFLAPERDGPPDIDVDIEAGRREEVIQYVYSRFGRRRAAQVANVISYRPRSAVRDAARALGYDVGQQDAWSKSIERWGSLRGPEPASQWWTVHKAGPVGPTPMDALPTWMGPHGVFGKPVAPARPDAAPRPLVVDPVAAEPEVPHGGRRRRPHVDHAPSVALSDATWTPTLARPSSDHAPPGTLSEDGHDVVPAHRPPPTSGLGEVPDAVLDLADRFLRLPRHLGIHSGGMVMCDRPVIEVCPVEWARMPGRTVLQWDKEDCADAGLVKFDLLGLGMLTALQVAFRLVHEYEGVGLGLHALPQEDPAVYDLLCAADTVGVFQVESRAQMATLPRLQPRCFYDIVIEVALIRPGPIQGGSVHPYINRVRGREPVTYLHPLLEKSLAKTRGVPLFQEQLMQMAIDVAGFTGAEADQLRRAMGSKRSMDKMEALRVRLMSGMAERGVTPPVAEQIYDKLKAFADFGFPESHAFSFAYLVYASAWLKVHHPAAFYAGLLAAQPMGFYSPQSLVADARRHGVTVLRPDVQASGTKAQLERLPPAPEPTPTLTPHDLSSRDVDSCGAAPRTRRTNPHLDVGRLVRVEPTLGVRMGLGSVRGVGTEVAEAVVAERAANGAFAGLRDLVRRVRLSTAQLEALATADALACFGVDRRTGLWAAGALAQEGPDTLPGVAVGVEAPTLPGMTQVEAAMADVWATGVSVDSYPTQYVRPGLVRAGVITVDEAMTHEAGRRVAVAGVVTHRQRPGTAQGVTFLSLEDETGLLNVVCTAGLWKRFRTVARTSAMVVRGRLERADNATNLLAEHLAPLSLQIPTSSRDYR